MTHPELVNRAERWLYNTLRCGYVITEKMSNARERPDALGLREYYTILVECKASVIDFKKDINKWFRKKPYEGMGDYRYYLVPDRMIDVTDIPENWGLLYAGKRSIKIVKKVFFEYKGKTGEIANPKNMMSEYMLMYSKLRELRESMRNTDVYK